MDAWDHIDFRRMTGKSVFGELRIRDYLFLLLSLGAIVLVFRGIPFVLEFVWSVLSIWWGQVVLTAVAVVIAYFLFYIREQYRLYYSLLELSFGVVSTWYAILLLLKGPRQWQVVVSAMYLIVRGLDNLKEGLRRRNATRLNECPMAETSAQVPLA